MSVDRERLRSRALRINQERAKEIEQEEHERSALIKKDLPEWIRVIEEAIAAGKLKVELEFYTDIGPAIYTWRGWKDQAVAPRIDLSMSATTSLYMYGEQLQRELGTPFSVYIYYSDQNSEWPSSWRNFVRVEWRVPTK